MEPVVGSATLDLAADAFTFKATGATADRSMRDRAADFVNVKDFGAVGDGVEDDLPWIQEAIDHLGSDGGVVFIPAGTYKIDAGRIFIRQPNITLRGEGWGTILQWAGTLPAGPFGGTGGMITVYPIDAVYPAPPGSYGTTLENVVVENMKLIGKHEGVYTVGSQGIEMENVKGGVIRGCSLEYFGAETILFDAAIGHYVGEYLVENCTTIGGGNVFNTGGSKSTRIIGNHFTANSFQGVEMASGGSSTVVGNVFRDMTGNIEILMDRTATSRSGTTFSGNVVENCQAITINTQSASQPTSVVVANNVIRKANGGAAIICYGGASTDAKVLVSGNVISETVTGPGILCNSGYGMVVSGNVIFNGPSGTTTYGIDADANAKPEIFGNHISGMAAGNEIRYVAAETVIGNNCINGVWKSGAADNSLTKRAGRISSLADDTASLLLNSDTVGGANVGVLTVSVRSSSTVNGRCVQSSFMAHVSGIGHHTQVFNHGTGPGTGAAISTTTLAGTTGTDGVFTVSVNTSGGKWQIQAENRTGEAVSVSWEVSCISP
jgi:hypothetical protein